MGRTHPNGSRRVRGMCCSVNGSRSNIVVDPAAASPCMAGAAGADWHGSMYSATRAGLAQRAPTLTQARRTPHVLHMCASAGDPKTDVSLSEDGTKRIITKTGVYSGTELHLWALPPYHDDRLPLRLDRPDLCFDVLRREITSSEEWQQVRTAQDVRKCSGRAWAHNACEGAGRIILWCALQRTLVCMQATSAISSVLPPIVPPSLNAADRRPAMDSWPPAPARPAIPAGQAGGA